MSEHVCWWIVGGQRRSPWTAWCTRARLLCTPLLWAVFVPAAPSCADPRVATLSFNDFPVDYFLAWSRRPWRQIPTLLFRPLLLLVRSAAGPGLDGGLPSAGSAPRLHGPYWLRRRTCVCSV